MAEFAWNVSAVDERGEVMPTVLGACNELDSPPTFNRLTAYTMPRVVSAVTQLLVAPELK